MPRDSAISSANMVLPVPGSPLISSGRSNVTAAFTAICSSSVAMYVLVLENFICINNQGIEAKEYNVQHFNLPAVTYQDYMRRIDIGYYHHNLML